VKARPGLVVLLVLMVVFLVIRSLPKKPSATAGIAGRPASSELFQEEFGRKSGSASKSSKSVPIPVLDLALLEPDLEGETFEIGRNLFRYAPPKPSTPPAPGTSGPGGYRPPPPRPPPRPPQTGGPTGPPPGKPPPPPRPPPMPPNTVLSPDASPGIPPKPQPPGITFKYLGSFGPKDRMLAVFTDGGEIYDVFEGETFAAQYILKKIYSEPDTVDIGFVGFDENTIEKLEVGP